jgi:hypothetical protein
VVAVIADVSASMTSDQWVRRAVELAVDVGASEIAVEGFAARETYQRVVNDALKRYRTPQRSRPRRGRGEALGRGGGDAMARSAALLQALEVGTCRLAGHLPTLEDQAVAWQAGQHQPDVLRRWWSPTTCWSLGWAAAGVRRTVVDGNTQRGWAHG